jgi:hypothetical protein
MADMDEYMRCLDVIAMTNHIDEEVFDFEEKPIRIESIPLPIEPIEPDNNDNHIHIEEDN